ncbi:G-type lectin S-receptor-like serine/threonine-protein kinase RKS1 [Linum grandiflorum]
MNPKISYFGIARIFGANQDKANTNRVVFLVNYMSSEYAMQRMFSVKSDVYNFGVLLLEILSGRKNSSYYEETSRTWELWKKGRAMEIVDSMLKHYDDAKDVLRCIHIGLLCVQESATDRLNIFDVAFMLCNVDTSPPTPRKPAFVLKKMFQSH